MATPNREKIKEMIESGTYTRKMIQEELGLSAASLATNFSYLRMMGFYPIVAEENKESGILSLTDKETWDTMKAASAGARSTAAAKTPKERYEALDKRLTRVSKALKLAADRAAANEDVELLQLKKDRAVLDVKITEIEIKDLTSSDEYIEFMRNYDDSAEDELDEDVEVEDGDEEFDEDGDLE